MYPKLHVVFLTTVSQCSVNFKAASAGIPMCPMNKKMHTTVDALNRRVQGLKWPQQRLKVLMTEHFTFVSSQFPGWSPLSMKKKKKKARPGALSKQNSFVCTFCFNLRHVLVQAADTLNLLYTVLTKLYEPVFCCF